MEKRKFEKKSLLSVPILKYLNRKLLNSLLLALFSFTLFSCASTGSESLEPVYVNVPETPTKSEKINEAILEKAISATPQVEYILGPEDLLEIDVFQVEELKRTVRVSSSGFIKLPLVGKLEVSGLTVSDLEARIAFRLRKQIRQPMVSVFIKEYRSQWISVLGAVNRPQVFAVTGQKYLLDMLSTAEGLKDGAGDVCYIQRGGETIVIDLDALLLEGDVKLNIPVFAKDVINVPIGGVVFVSGEVNEPGSFVVKGTLTLTQAITMARGFKNNAVRSEITIFRDTGTEMKETIDVDYNDIIDKKLSDIILKDKDVIHVPLSSSRDFISRFLDSIRDIISIGYSHSF